MEKIVALLIVGAGIALGGATLGVFPRALSFIDASQDMRLAVAGGLILIGLGLLARDHRGSEILSALALLAISVGTGWFTFYGPPGVVETRLDFIPDGVSESLGQLMFGLGVVVCGVTAFFGLRKLLG
ncbi:MAG: hypothetical protein AAGF92_23805 [Myxococcota bacterium]